MDAMRKNQDRRQTSDDHLREKLAKKHLQPLDAFAQYGKNISGSALIELPWTHGEAMLEQLSPEFDFDARRVPWLIRSRRN